MIKAVLIDDEALALEQLEYLLEPYPDVQIQAKFTDPVKALEAIQGLRPDLIFLDVEMPEISGLVIAEEVMSLLPETRVVFVTAYDEYLLKALDYYLIDYILKPVSPKRFKLTMQKVLLYTNGNKENRVEEIRLYDKRYNKTVVIGVEERGQIKILKPDEVIMFKPLDRWSTVCISGKQYENRHSLSFWEDRLSDKSFFRCHRSYLINIEKIDKLESGFNGTYSLKMVDYSEIIPVSRGKAKELKIILGV